MTYALYDAIIIGAGVTGSSVAYQLSKKEGRFLVLEATDDVCQGTSKANSAIAHGGYDAVPGSLKAKMNVKGQAMMAQMAEDLDFDCQPIGSLVLCPSDDRRKDLEALLHRGEENGVQGLRIVEREELEQMEPNIADGIVCALYCENAGIVDPFMMNIAFAEQSVVNGFEYRFYQKVIGIHREGENWCVQTQNDSYLTRTVVNAAGVFADQIHNFVSDKPYHIQARRGEYLLLDRNTKGTVNHVIFGMPSAKGKGILVAPTCDGNTLVGPTADFVASKTDTDTTKQGLIQVREQAETMIKDIPYNQVITSFAGLRAHEDGDDFILQESEPGFFDCVGIESPGLTSAPAIGVYMAQLVQDYLQLPENENFIAKRKGIVKTRDMSVEDKAQLIAENPAYSRIICRCESVTEGEILDAIHRPLGAHSLDSLKRRCRVTAGRCQGGFCTPRLIEILCRELHLTPEEVTKRGTEAYLLTGRSK